MLLSATMQNDWISSNRISETAYGEIMIIDKENWILFSSITNWITKLQYVFINSKYNYLKKYIEISKTDFKNFKNIELN